MIWFPCNQCGKVLGRSESSAGALVFCGCGQNLRVPWESTAAPPPVETLPILPATPLPVSKPNSPPPPPLVLEPEEPSGRRGRRTRNSPIDPNACFTHPAEPKVDVCVACGLGFCRECCTTFQRETLCAPCKNYRTRLYQRRPESPSLAYGSLLLAIAAGPMLLALFAVSATPQSSGWTAIAWLPSAAAIVAGVVALRWTERGSNRGGRQLALSGIVLGAFVVLFTGLLVSFGHKLLV